MQGLDKLKSNEPLMPEEKGFAEIGRVIKQKLQENNPSSLIDRISILRLDNIGGTKVSIGSTVLGDSSRVRARLSNRQNVEISFNNLQQEFDKIRSKRLFITAVIIFSLGIFLQVLGFVTQVQESKQDLSNFRPDH